MSKYDLLRRNLRYKSRYIAEENVGFLLIAGWSSPVARQAHNLKVVGSNPAPATNLKPSEFPMISGFFGGLLSLFLSVNTDGIWRPENAFWDQIHGTFTVHQWHSLFSSGTERVGASISYAGKSRAGNAPRVSRQGKRPSKRSTVGFS